jgi:hypothetical protein
MLRTLKTRKFLILKKARNAKNAILAYLWHVYGTRVSAVADYPVRPITYASSRPGGFSFISRLHNTLNSSTASEILTARPHPMVASSARASRAHLTERSRPAKKSSPVIK